MKNNLSNSFTDYFRHAFNILMSQHLDNFDELFAIDPKHYFHMCPDEKTIIVSATYYRLNDVEDPPINYIVRLKLVDGELKIDSIIEFKASEELDRSLHVYSMCSSYHGKHIALGLPNLKNGAVIIYNNENIATELYNPSNVNSLFGYDIAASDCFSRIVITAPMKDNKGIVYIYDKDDKSNIYRVITTVAIEGMSLFGIEVTLNDTGNYCSIKTGNIKLNMNRDIYNKEWKYTNSDKVTVINY